MRVDECEGQPETRLAPPRSILQELAGGADPTGLQLLRLIKTTANLYDTVTDQALSASALSGPRWHVLIRLLVHEERNQGEGLSPSYLSRCLNVSRNTVSALLRGLEEQGLIDRTLDPLDKRGFCIRLSDKGRALVHASAPRHLAYLKRLVSDLSPDDQVLLIELLDRLHRSLAAHCREPAAVGEAQDGLDSPPGSE